MNKKETFQYSKPVFVRDRYKPIKVKGKWYKYNDYFPWQEVGLEAEKAQIMYDIDRLYHNEELEVESKVGDRLSELKGEKLKKLVRLTNALVKKRCTTDKEYQSKKVKGSLVEEKQRGLIRAWVNRNNWALDEYYEIRDSILVEPNQE